MMNLKSLYESDLFNKPLKLIQLINSSNKPLMRDSSTYPLENHCFKRYININSIIK